MKRLAKCASRIGAGLLALACSSQSLSDPAEGAAAAAGNAAAGAGGNFGGRPSTGGGVGTPEIPGTVALPSTARLVPLYEAPHDFSATALAFDPLRPGELWVTLRRFPSGAPCTAQVMTGCSALRGQIAQVTGATGSSPAMRIRRDGNAWHFMRRPTSIAFGTNGNLATCAEARTGNYEDEDADYIGPTLWSSDPEIFGAVPEPNQNGTHLDMLHSTPFCMGIAHERDNIYFTFNGKLGSLDRYDFKAPHEIGGEDHSDGELYRYVEGELERVPEVPSHLALDAEQAYLYVCDTGHQRVARLDINSGTQDGEVLSLDPLPVHVRMSGARFETWLAPGVLQAPSGIALAGSTIFVTDNATSHIHAFDRDGVELAKLNTGLPTGSLSGIAVGPDGKLYISDLLTGNAYRVD